MPATTLFAPAPKAVEPREVRLGRGRLRGNGVTLHGSDSRQRVKTDMKVRRLCVKGIGSPLRKVEKAKEVES
jgi:hypothetical protein